MLLEAAVIKGDGVGAEMMEQATDVLEAVCDLYGHRLNLIPVRACGETIESCRAPLPQESLKICQSVPAVLFGNTGLKKYQSLPLEKRSEAALMKLRSSLGVTTNIRPVKYYPGLESFSPLKEELLHRGLDFVFVRDIAGGVFCSEKVSGNGPYGQEAYEYEYYNERIVTDTARIAFDLADKRKKRVVNLDKSNVLESSRLWRRTVQTVAEQYPDLLLEHCYIDSAAMKILECPQQFDVLVTSNLFGDIISDEGTQMTGTPYLYASAEVNQYGRGIYTPNQLHHPDESVIGKWVVNPIGMIAAGALMLRHTFQLEKEAGTVEQAIERVLNQGLSTREIWSPGRRLAGTREIGKAIREELEHV